MGNKLPSSVTVTGNYETENSSVEEEGEVTVSPEDVLDELNEQDVMDYYNKNGSAHIDTYEAKLERLKFYPTSVIEEFLEDEIHRGTYSDINFEKLFKELK